MNKKFELAVNVAIIVTCVLLVGTLIRLNWPQAQRNSRRPQIQVGDIVNVPGLDLSGNRRTYLLVLQTTCHFCTESAPFYRRLSQAIARRPDLRIVAVLPQPVEASKQYLSEHGIPIQEVKQVVLSDAKLTSTPTLMIISPSGKAERVLVGQLSSSAEETILALD